MQGVPTSPSFIHAVSATAFAIRHTESLQGVLLIHTGPELSRTSSKPTQAAVGVDPTTTVRLRTPTQRPQFDRNHVLVLLRLLRYVHRGCPLQKLEECQPGQSMFGPDAVWPPYSASTLPRLVSSIDRRRPSSNVSISGCTSWRVPPVAVRNHTNPGSPQATCEFFWHMARNWCRCLAPL